MLPVLLNDIKYISVLRFYPVIICSIRVLITSNDLRSHPVRGTNEGVSPPHRPIQLSTHTKVN